MLTSEMLEILNEIMLGRGSPDERDDFGYNIPDYKKLSSIWRGATNNDLYEIASRLLKYYDTQLKGIDLVNFTKEELIETIEYYKELSEKNIIKSSVTIAFTNDYKNVYVGFKYNNDFIDIMRKYKYSFDREVKSWLGDSSNIKAILKELEELGADVVNALCYIEIIEEENSISFSETIENTEEIKTDKLITVKKVDEDNISLKFDYDYVIVSEIKSLKSKHFDWDTKEWIINIFEAKTLYENIKHLGYDLSELKPYTDNTTVPKIKVVSINNLDVELSFPYLSDVVNCIKQLSFYKFDRKKTTWIIDIREKDLLANKAKNIIDVTELMKLEGIREPEKVNLKDFSYLKRKPFKHQLEAAEFLLRVRKGAIFDEMGSGKTMSSLLAAYSLPSPRLVVCPASLKLNWAKEIGMVDYNGRICVIGDKWISENADWYIINYDILERDYKKLEDIPFTCIILDEAHYIKSISNGGKPNSKRANYAIKLAENYDYVFSLTGTPITNKPKDIFNILRISDHILARNFFTFAQKYCDATHNGFGWSFEGSSNEEELHEKIKPMALRRLKKDMLDLPEKIRRFIPVEINMADYNKAVKEYISKKKSINSNGEHLTYLTTIKHILAKEKVNSTIEIAETILDSNEAVVIFTNYNAVVDRLMNHFGELATKITGSCDSKTRQQAVDDFQSGKKKVMVANIIAGGVGITLIKANNLIFNDFSWIPAEHMQAEDRIHRIGQSLNCTVNYLYVPGAEIDDYMTEMLERKSVYINKIIDGGSGDQLDISKEVKHNLIQSMINDLYKTA